MCLKQDFLADVFITRNTNLVLAPTYSLLILMKLGGFAPLHDLANFLDRGTALLGLTDAFFEIVMYPQLTQQALWHCLKLEITHFLTQLSWYDFHGQTVAVALTAQGVSNYIGFPGMIVDL
jgi:hypothetical protein